MTRRELRTPLLLSAATMLAACGGASPPAEPISLPAVAPQPSPPAEQVEPPAATELPQLPVRPFAESEQAMLDGLVFELRAAASLRRADLLDQLERELGGRGLVAALDVVGDKPTDATQESRHWLRTTELFNRLETLADPSCANALHAWWGRSRDEHWKGRAATVLASLGDVRAATGLARRLRYEPTDLYRRESFWQADEGGHLSRSDRPRIVAVRLLADLATLHPAQRAQLRRTAEQPALTWMLKGHAPHANAMRLMALARSNQGGQQLAHWATPTEPLPAVGAQPPFPLAFEVSQSALRYVGASGQPRAYEVLIAQLERKPRDLDISQEALLGAGMAMRGMALRALTVGAANGLAELGDERAYDALSRIASDARHHEEAREAACDAMAWCAPKQARQQMARAVVSHASASAPTAIQQATCLAASLTRRPTPDIGETLVSALERAKTTELRLAIAGALAASGTAAIEDRLIALLDDDDARATAAAALILAGSPAGARRAATAAQDDPAAQDALFFVSSAIGPSDEHLELGTLDRWAENLRALPPEMVWPTLSLNAFFDNVLYDRGPHTMTRIVLRRRLIHRALWGSDRQRQNARTLLALMQERGALWYLARHEGRATGDRAEEPTHGD